MRIIAATQNKNKLLEIDAITAKYGLKLATMDEVGLGGVDVEETGTTCPENSMIKARAVCRLSGEPAIADDTGLMIDALGGAPGIYSARFAGEHGNDAANRAKVLELMKDIPYEKRTARFICAITLCYPDGRSIAVEGYCEGHIATEERGERGFGYDSLFIPQGYDKTFAQLDVDIKNTIGHRANALAKLQKELEKTEI